MTTLIGNNQNVPQDSREERTPETLRKAYSDLKKDVAALRASRTSRLQNFIDNQQLAPLSLNQLEKSKMEEKPVTSEIGSTGSVSRNLTQRIEIQQQDPNNLSLRAESSSNRPAAKKANTSFLTADSPRKRNRSIIKKRKVSKIRISSFLMIALTGVIGQ